MAALAANGCHCESVRIWGDITKPNNYGHLTPIHTLEARMMRAGKMYCHLVNFLTVRR